MNKKYFFDAPSFGPIGTPYDPFGRIENSFEAETRVMPSQFRFPELPMNFHLIRNTEQKDDRPQFS